jgi:hypothetical protein
MTELEWLACDNPDVLCGFFIGAPEFTYSPNFPHSRGSSRKLRLFACACYRRVASRLPQEPAMHCADVAERFADGTATAEDLLAANNVVRRLAWQIPGMLRDLRREEQLAQQPRFDAIRIANELTTESAAQAAYGASSNAYLSAGQFVGYDAERTERRAQARLFRCVFGNPFQPAQLSQETLYWGGGTVVKIATEIYEAQAFEQAPILADALEESGDNTSAVGHLRHGGPHVRGCWVLDLILGKA